ncbi:hypothetical protein FNF29_00087 [Cafeteria roenbergensis]|uniref:AP2/ERF domain-containing protein n=1 Tax=Cafeteria roenbergensis TaxID=33653 RepID=A0A5A8D0J2_CAFRO|nr:hypothetical protein FNF29_00087 [Cafeteria roenbergensis]|eukprot:KAA0157511.1 hypothetical protein FNF29_00087 [Cafeteria roenbergensis]
MHLFSAASVHAEQHHDTGEPDCPHALFTGAAQEAAAAVQLAAAGNLPEAAAMAQAAQGRLQHAGMVVAAGAAAGPLRASGGRGRAAKRRRTGRGAGHSSSSSGLRAVAGGVLGGDGDDDEDEGEDDVDDNDIGDDDDDDDDDEGDDDDDNQGGGGPGTGDTSTNAGVGSPKAEGSSGSGGAAEAGLRAPLWSVPGDNPWTAVPEPDPASLPLPRGGRTINCFRPPMAPRLPVGAQRFTFEVATPTVPRFAALSPTLEHLPVAAPKLFPGSWTPDGSSRYAGVRKGPPGPDGRNTWWACVERLGACRWLGPFRSESAAARAADVAMLLSTGPAATTNFAYNTDELFADAGLADAEGTLAQLHGRFYAQAYRITRRFHAQDVEAELARRRELEEAGLFEGSGDVEEIGGSLVTGEQGRRQGDAVGSGSGSGQSGGGGAGSDVGGGKAGRRKRAQRSSASGDSGEDGAESSGDGDEADGGGRTSVDGDADRAGRRPSAARRHGGPAQGSSASTTSGSSTPGGRRDAETARRRGASGSGLSEAGAKEGADGESTAAGEDDDDDDDDDDAPRRRPRRRAAVVSRETSAMMQAAAASFVAEAASTLRGRPRSTATIFGAPSSSRRKFTSPYRGVDMGTAAPRGRWRARIDHDGRRSLLGSFATARAAALAYDAKALELRGRWAKTNFGEEEREGLLARGWANDQPGWDVFDERLAAAAEESGWPVEESASRMRAVAAAARRGDALAAGVTKLAAREGATGTEGGAAAALRSVVAAGGGVGVTVAPGADPTVAQLQLAADEQADRVAPVGEGGGVFDGHVVRL